MTETLLGMPLLQGTEAPARIAMILWGPPGSGKTSLALTAPGRKLCATFDPGGMDSCRHVPNVKFADLSAADAKQVELSWNSEDPLGIKQYIDNYDTIIVDSLTRYSELAMRHAVSRAKNATVEQPTIQAHGMRNTYVLTFMSKLVAQTSKANKHLIFITHEGAPDKNDEGHVVSVSMMLGGQLPNLTSKDFNEVWHVSDRDTIRRIAVRPEKQRAPMKTRLFDAGSATGFTWKFDVNKWEGEHMISKWFDQWVARGMLKVPLPK